MKLTPEQLEEIKQRANAATLGPWRNAAGRMAVRTFMNGDGLREHQPICDCNAAKLTEQENGSNADFIAHARTDIPALLAHIDALTKERDAIALGSFGASQAMAAENASLRAENALLRQYADLLNEEAGETCPIAHAHGWRSTRHEIGKEMRAKIGTLDHPLNRVDAARNEGGKE